MITIDPNVVPGAVADAVRETLGENLLILADGRIFHEDPSASAVSPKRFELVLGVIGALALGKVVDACQEQHQRRRANAIALRPSSERALTIREAIKAALELLGVDLSVEAKRENLRWWVRDYALHRGVVLSDVDFEDDINAALASLRSAP